jgi:protoporphyrinogen oxidase
MTALMRPAFPLAEQSPWHTFSGFFGAKTGCSYVTVSESRVSRWSSGEAMTLEEPVVILGGGIAGLATAHFLKEAGYDAVVFEASDRPGGVTRSFQWHGFTCDVAVHRFFSPHHGVLEEVQKVVPLIKMNRRSRIFLHDRILTDPISPTELVLRMPPLLSVKLVLGYLFHTRRPDTNFDNYVHNRYGPGLNDLFFKPYTEKMFGIPSHEVSTEWGEQKVRVSGLIDVIKKNTKIYFRYFHYPPTGGFGTIANSLKERIGENLWLESDVVGLEYSGDRISNVTIERHGRQKEIKPGTVISTVPITDLGHLLDHKVDLRFRPIQIAYLLVDKHKVSDYHWIYFGDSDIHINRLGEFKNFVANGTPDGRTVLSAEITRETDDPVNEAIRGCERYNLLSSSQVLDSLVVREAHAYPIYECNYLEKLRNARDYFSHFRNLHLVGRNALFHHAEIDDNFLGAKQLVEQLLSAE